MEIWIWLFVAYRIISSTTPLTSKVGALLGMVNMVAVPVFCVLCFVCVSAWWYGLIALGIYLLVPMLVPRIDPDETGSIFRAYSMIFSHVSTILVVFMYLSLFGIM